MRRVVIAALVVFTFCGANASAQTIVKSYIGTATIEKIRYHGSGFFGGCLAQVSVNVNTAGSNTLDCGTTNLVSFGCTGDYGSKADAKNAFDVAQLAYVTGTPVSIQVTNQKFNSNVCFADFIMTASPQ